MLKKIVILAAAIAMAAPAAAQVSVRGYYRSDGTYVQPHYRSRPDSNPYNNWSTRGNVNPYTGSAGTRNPYSGYGSDYSRPYGSGTLNSNGSSSWYDD